LGIIRLQLFSPFDLIAFPATVFLPPENKYVTFRRAHRSNGFCNRLRLRRQQLDLP
jgi:hypothetical protein